MKTITELNGTDFLRQCNKVRYAVQDILKETNVLKIRETKPTLTGKESPEEVERLYREQSNKNLSKMVDVMLEEKPEETMKLFRLLVTPDEGETEPSGFEMVMIGLNILSDKRVLDFLSSLIRLGQTNMGD